MQITFNQSEVEVILSQHVLDNLPGTAAEEITSVVVNADGTATIVIGEEVSHEDDTPPVVAEQPTRRRRRSNPQEAKHRPVEPAPAEPETGEQIVEPVKEEAQTKVEAPTSVGGQSETTTPEPEAAAEEPQPETEVETQVEEPVVEEKPAAKPSLFANLKR